MWVSHGRGFLGIAIMGILFGLVVVLQLQGKAVECIAIQKNQWPSNLQPSGGDTHVTFLVGLVARCFMARVEMRYSFLCLDTSVNLTRVNEQETRFGNLSDAIGEIAWLLDSIRGYPAGPEIRDLEIEVNKEKHAARLYDFTKFFPASIDTATKALTTFLVVFGGDGTVMQYYRGVSDFLNEEESGCKLESLTVTQGGKRQLWYSAGVSTGEIFRSIEERPLMGVVRFENVGKGSILGVAYDVRPGDDQPSGRWVQLVRIYVDGRFQQAIANFLAS